MFPLNTVERRQRETERQTERFEDATLWALKIEERIISQGI